MWKQLRQPRDAAPPPARSSHSLTAIREGGHLVLWGGEHAPRAPIDPAIWVYDMAAGTWTSAATTGDAPSARLGHAAAAVGDTVYVHGGRTEVAEGSSLSDLYSYDAATAAWARISTASGPPRRNYHACVAADASVYVFGGCGDGGRLADLWRFDTVAGRWEELPQSDAIKGRGGAGLVAAAGSLWVLGGFTGSEASDVHRFDLRANAWEEVPARGDAVRFSARSVFARASHSSCAAAACGHRDHILVFGGEVDPCDQGHAGAGQFADDLCCLDTSALSWHRVAAAGAVGGEGPAPRGWAASSEVPAGLVVSGGIDESNTRLGDLWLLDLHV